MTTAVLIIDMQNGFCSAAGSLNQLVGDIGAVRSVTTEINALLRQAREASLPIYFTRHVCRDNMIDATPRARAIGGIVGVGITPLLRGSWDAEIIEQLSVSEDDTVIDKIRYDAFLYTELDALLRAAGVTRLLVAGLITSLCVESSVRSAEQRGYDVSVAADACAGPAPSHEASLAVMDGAFATVGSWRELLTDLLGPSTTPVSQRRSPDRQKSG